MHLSEVELLGLPAEDPPLRLLALTSSSLPDNHRHIEITFASRPGDRYAIEQSLDLETWSCLAGGIPSQGAETTHPFSAPANPERFFHVRRVAE